MTIQTVPGLVLSGGGARAAYQVGAISAIADILPACTTPFSILTGVSAGAINAFALACQADRFAVAAQNLWNTWSTITPEKIYRTDLLSLSGIGARWLRELAGGGLLSKGSANHLLDTSPLRELLLSLLLPSQLPKFLDSGLLHAVAVSATNYHTGTAVTFYDCGSSPSLVIPPWSRSMRLGRRTSLDVRHVLASSAIPLFFPPVELDGSYFGDGCVRLNAPLSPAIHLGATKIVAVGIRYPRPAETTFEINVPRLRELPSLGEIGGVLLNAVFLDSLESDVERMQRINQTIHAVQLGSLETRTSLREIPILTLQPSQDLGLLAVRQHQHFPWSLRYLLRGLGITDRRGGDLLSYLAFEPHYIGKLLQLGYRDTMDRRTSVQDFLACPQ